MSGATYYLNGKEVTAKEFRAGGGKPDWLKASPMIATACRQNKPRVSDSMGVLPNQVAGERAKLQELRDRGELTGVSIRDDGAVEYTSNGEQGATGWQRYRGNKVNLDGGYSDTYTADDRFGAEPE
jgi:hypothetical protein